MQIEKEVFFWEKQSKAWKLFLKRKTRGGWSNKSCAPKNAKWKPIENFFSLLMQTRRIPSQTSFCKITRRTMMVLIIRRIKSKNLLSTFLDWRASKLLKLIRSQDGYWKHHDANFFGQGCWKWMVWWRKSCWHPPPWKLNLPIHILKRHTFNWISNVFHSVLLFILKITNNIMIHFSKDDNLAH